jgi:hypothetical protein
MRERKDLTAGQRDAVLGGNACRFYQLDATAIARARGGRQVANSRASTEAAGA